MYWLARCIVLDRVQLPVSDLTSPHLLHRTANAPAARIGYTATPFCWLHCARQKLPGFLESVSRPERRGSLRLLALRVRSPPPNLQCVTGCLQRFASPAYLSSHYQQELYNCWDGWLTAGRSKRRKFSQCSSTQPWGRSRFPWVNSDPVYKVAALCGNSIAKTNSMRLRV